MCSSILPEGLLGATPHWEAKLGCFNIKVWGRLGVTPLVVLLAGYRTGVNKVKSGRQKSKIEMTESLFSIQTQMETN